MNCAQVEDLLSAYLDNALASEERRAVAVHLHQCNRCSIILADFRRFDALLSQLPRVNPAPELRDRIFSSPEYLELTGTFDAHAASGEEEADNWTVPHPAAKHVRRDTPGRPRLVAIPGGRSGHSTHSTSSAKPTLGRVPLVRQSHRNGKLRVALGALVAAVLVTLALGSILALNLISKQVPITGNRTTTPPVQDQPQQVPLSAGERFVFLRGGALWSTLSDGSSKPERLTSTNVTVGPNWIVSPPLPGRSAGDMVAYIDLQGAAVHTIRSDGLQDTIVKQPLLKTGVQPTSIWDTQTGTAILNSLTWSNDGSMLAFVADPAGTGFTNLYIYSKETGLVQMVALPTKGSVSHPVWSPDGVRLAFELTHNGTVSILDYNTQNHGLLTIADGIASQSSVGDSVLTLDWSADVDMPTITWSVGTIGHVQSIWVRRVDVASTVVAQLLTSGDYVQAIYSRSGHDNAGSWLLVSSVIGRPGDLWRIDAIPGASLVALTNGRQVGFAWWSPDGTQVDYLDAISAGVGTFHVVNLATGIDTLIASGVADTPAPAWSTDSQQLVYSTGTEIAVVNPANLQTIQKPLILKLHGPASAFAWSATANSSHQLVVAQNDVQQGIYLVNTQQNTFVQVDNSGASDPIWWTEIP